MGKFFKKFFKITDGIRRFLLGLFFWGILIALVVGIFHNPAEKIVDGDSLYLAPQGYIVDEYSQSPTKQTMDSLLSIPPSETLLSELKRSLELASKDHRINSVVLDLSGYGGAGLATLEDFRRSLIAFRKSGKPLYAYSYSLNQGALYLTAVADEVSIDPMGEVFIKGFGAYRSYYKEGLDRWGVNTHIYRAGDHKSYVEPYIRNSMTSSERAMTSAYLNDLWQSYLSESAYALGLEKSHLQHYSDSFGSLLSLNRVSAAQLALNEKLIDKILSYADFNALMVNRNGVEKESDDFKQIYWQDYLSREDNWQQAHLLAQNKIALLTLSGNIMGGSGNWDTINSTYVEQALKAISNDHTVDALVVRVNSPGGSAVGSEMIRRRLEEFHTSGIPLIISMGDVAASGGYWIACEGDEIFAENTTVTGSIGVFSLFFTLEDTLKDKLGVTIDGFGTTEMSDAFIMGRDTSSQMDLMMQSNVDQIYTQFLALVSERRAISVKELEGLAGGRVWTGRQAKENGLVDSIGGLTAALDRAAELSNLGSDYAVVEYSDNAYESSALGADQLASVLGGLAQNKMLKNLPWAVLLNSLDQHEFVTVPDNNPFLDPRKINAWSDL